MRAAFDTDEAYLAAINAEMRHMGLKTCKTLAEARKTNRVAGDVPTPEKSYGPRGNGHGHAAVKFASEKQIHWLVKLANKAPDAVTAETCRKAVAGENVSMKSASAALDVLFNLPRDSKPVQTPANVQTTPTKAPESNAKPISAPFRPATQEGIYKLGEALCGTAGASLYKVQISKSSGQPYAMLWTLFESPVETAKGLKFGEFVFTSGAIRKLSADDMMTYEEAAAFGIEFHFCCRCGIELTNPESIERGIGPICKDKF